MPATAATPQIARLSANGSERLDPAFRQGVVAIGSFDGVHRGHRALIDRTKGIAARLGSQPIALTFEPHPQTVLRPGTPFFRLSAPPAKRLLLGLAGATRIVEIDFDAALIGLSAEDFVAGILVERLGVRGVVVGDGFRFGNRRAGDVALLNELGKRHGYTVEIASTVTTDDGVRASSGRARAALADGSVDEANRVLGYRWFVTGKVVPGDRRGRELGYPTANVDLPVPIGLSHGIYAVSAGLQGHSLLEGIASFGVRPMFDGKAPILEVHLFGFDGDIYGRDLAVFFHAKLRNEERFESTAALVRQMDIDAVDAKAVLAAAGAGTDIDQALATRLR